MITTNKTQPKQEKGDKKLRVLTTNTVQPREFDFQPRNYGGFVKKQTRKVTKDMLTPENMEKRARNDLRIRLMRKRKAALAQKTREVAEELKGSMGTKSAEDMKKLSVGTEKAAEKLKDAMGTKVAEDRVEEKAADIVDEIRPPEKPGDDLSAKDLGTVKEKEKSKKRSTSRKKREKE